MAAAEAWPIVLIGCYSKAYHIGTAPTTLAPAAKPDKFNDMARAAELMGRVSMIPWLQKQ